jgi:hypothetical protein
MNTLGVNKNKIYESANIMIKLKTKDDFYHVL